MGLSVRHTISKLEVTVKGKIRRTKVAYFGAVALTVALLGGDTRMTERSGCTSVAFNADKTGLVIVRSTKVRRDFITRSKQKDARQAAMHLKVEKVEITRTVKSASNEGMK